MKQQNKPRKHSLKLRQKILLIFIVTWVISICSISTVAIASQISSSRNKEIQEDVANLGVCKQGMQTLLEKVNLAGIRFIQSQNVRDLLDSSFTELPETEQGAILVAIGQQLYENTYVATFGTDTSVLFFCADGRTYANTATLLQLYQEEAFDFTLELPEGNSGEDSQFLGFRIGANQAIASERYTGYLQYHRVFRLSSDSAEKGELILLLPPSSMRKVFSRVSNGKDWMVLSQDGTIITHASDEAVIGQNIMDVFQVSASDFADSTGSVSCSLDGQSILLSYCADPEYGLYYVYTMPTVEIYRSSLSLVATVILVAVVSLLVLIYLSWYLSRRFTEPLDKLRMIMLRAGEGDLDVRMNPKFDDEIGVMGAQFDKMIGQLKDSIANIQRIEQENRKAELKMLELQINPHFLYNTLSSIIWLANEDQTDNVIDITKSLALFYRLALSEGQEMIPVRDELEHVRNYIKIQHYRYQDELNVEYEIAPEAEQCQTLKLLLQPLVENSINHGIRLLDEKRGLIRICAAVTGDTLVLEVWDNGTQLDETGARDLNAALEQGTSGIGTSNVYGRIKSHYGEAYGLCYSRVDGWTVARITMPVRKEADE